MKFRTLYRISFYLMLLLATLIMCVDATDSVLSMVFPAVVAVAGIGAFLTVERHPRLGLPRGLANFLGLVSILLVGIEYALNEHNLIIALPHLLVYLQLIKMFLPKKVEDDWLLFLLGLMQVLVGSYISQSDRVGVILLLWAVLALWVLGLFSLHRDALRFRDVAGGSADPERQEPYPGLINLAFLFTTLRVTALTLALGGAIFLLMPRRSDAGRRQNPYLIGKHLTGFDDEVQLGLLGEILEDDSLVMTIETFNEDDVRIKPGEAPLWRGVTLAFYEGRGHWRRRRSRIGSFPKDLPSWVAGKQEVRQQIKLEPNDSSVLFGLRPMLGASAGPHSEPDLNLDDGTITRPYFRPGSFDYRVISLADPDLPQPGELPPDPGRKAPLTLIPSALKMRLREIAHPIVAAIPPEDVVARCRALESFLRDSGRFGYTLRMGSVDPTLDPVLDFLVNRREGHCAYFASALTLLLRAIDIPARMVNGFKGGDWNDLAQMYSVRQKHAHSWVEAYVGGGRDRTARWITLDPTPSGAQRRSVAQVGGIITYFRQLTDLVRYVWVFYIVGFNAERQERVIYEPIRHLIREARAGFRLMGEALRSVAADLFYFRKVESLISIPGFFISFFALLCLVSLFRAGLWLWQRIRRWYRADADSDPLAARVAFYRRLAQVLSAYGLERPPAETQAEFARRATVFLTGRGSSTEAVADVPRLVVESFYRVRFGQRDLDPAELTHLETRLDALEAGLRSTRA